jgi:hypothetical protein
MKSILLILSVVISSLVLSCSHSHDHDHDGDHAEAYGYALFNQNNVEVLRVQNATPSDSIRIGVDSTSQVFTVKFLDDKNELFTPTEAELSLRITFGNGAIASETISNRWNFTVKGLSAGTTSMRISLFHDDHADFVAAPVYVVVQ